MGERCSHRRRNLGSSSAAGGGRFGNGFLSGFAGGTAGALSGGNPIAAAILGGTVSKIGGGKFASGAKSGFFHAMFGESLKQGFSGTSGISSTTGSDATDAKLAMGVYEPEFTGADGYELVERFADGKNGLNAALFANGNDRVLVFAGTDPGSWANWKANFAQAFGFKSAQYEMGIKLATDLQAAYGNIRFTGHSLGGGIASAAAIITGGSATTFNAAGVHDNTLRGFARSNGSIRAYYGAFDMLRFGNAFTPASVAGQQISLGVAGLHGMDGVCQVAGC